MLRNYLNTAYRLLVRSKAFSLINIFGLAVGLTSCLIIYIYITNELSFDRFHDNYQNIYRVASKENNPEGESKSTAIPYPFTQAVRDNLTGFEEITFVSATNNDQVIIDNKIIKENGILYVGTEFPRIFNVELVAGSFELLNEPFKILITENTAEKYFGDKNPLGMVVSFNNLQDFEVVGIIKDTPLNTHLPYHVLASESSLNDDLVVFDFNRWNLSMGGFYCYLELKTETNSAQFTEQLNNIIHEISTTDDDDTEYILQPINKVHLSNDYHYISLNNVTVNPKFILALSVIGLFILVIACINFVNLSTVKTIKRAREIGIRKVIGATKRTLIFQNLSETFILVLISEIIAVILTEISLPKLSFYFNIKSQLNIYGSFHIFVFMFLILLVVVLLSGLYPAFVLSGFSPIKSLKSNQKLKSLKTFSLRNGLVTFQFIISQVLIISSIFVALQINYINKKDLGFDKDNIWSIQLPINDNDRYEQLKQELEHVPGINMVSFGMGGPIAPANINTQFALAGTDVWGNINLKPADEYFNDIFNIDLLAGRWLKPLIEGDTIVEFVVNKALIDKIGFPDPNEALGKIITCSSFTGEIVGITDVFNVEDLKDEISVVALIDFPRFFWTGFFKANMNSELRFKLKEAWTNVYPEYLFDLKNYSDTIDEMYQNEDNIFKLILFFSILAIIIACLGLYGLVSFIVVQRTKELGIRKVLGASGPSIIILVTKQFLWLVVISCVFAWPIAFYIMKRWLENYAFKIGIYPWVFFVSLFLLLMISFITILYQSVKASRTNPVESLKYE
ncbi:MAG: FtsX-like permease family protein [Bacteroidales bacterium]|nr:FtsX-like permease family protein [Bacteroidales bacterium]